MFKNYFFAFHPAISRINQEMTEGQKKSNAKSNWPSFAKYTLEKKVKNKNIVPDGLTNASILDSFFKAKLCASEMIFSVICRCSCSFSAIFKIRSAAPGMT